MTIVTPGKSAPTGAPARYAFVSHCLLTLFWFALTCRT